MELKFKSGLQNTFNNLSNKSEGTFYYCTDNNKLYIGNKEIGENSYLKLTGGSLSGDLLCNKKVIYKYTTTYYNSNSDFVSDYCFGLYQWNNVFQYTYRNALNDTYLGTAFEIDAVNGKTDYKVIPTVNGNNLALYSDIVTYTSNAIANLVNGAPEDLNTLDELAAALRDNKDILNAFAVTGGSNATGTWPIGVTGNAGTATKLATARTITLNGDVTGSGSFDGSGNLTITVTVADNSHNHTNYVTLDGTQVISGDKTFSGVNTFMAESKFTNSGYCPTWVDIASGIGKSSCFTRGAFMQAIIGQLIAPNATTSETTSGATSTAGQLPIYTISTYNNGQPTLSKIGYFNSSGWNGAVVGNASTATTASKLSTNAGAANRPVYFSGGVPVAGTYVWNWSGQSGQPSWVWGGSDGANMYVYNPSNFNVNSATSAYKVIDYNSDGTPIKIGYTGAGLSGDGIKYFAAYGTDSEGSLIIKDVSIDNAKARLGVDDKVSKSGDTMTGTLFINSTTGGSYNECIRVNRHSSNAWANIVFGGAAGSTEGTGAGIWLVGAMGTDADQNKGFVICENGSSTDTGLYIQGNGSGTITWKGNQLLHAGNYASYGDSRYVNVSGDTMSGALTVNAKMQANTVGVTSAVTLQFDSTNKCLNFVFA